MTPDPQTRDFLVHPDMAGRFRRLPGGAMVADNAVVVGDVRLGEGVSIWFGVTIRGDDSWIELGAGTNVQDNTCIHVDVGAPHRIGRNVTIGHGAVLHGVEVGDHCLIGMGSTILGGVRIGEYSIIGAGALVPENLEIPPRSVVLGVPGRVRRETTEAEMADIRWRARHYIERAKTYLAT